jgi:uncharacterized protein
VIAFLDTSAVVKRYVAEEGTDDVLALWDRAEHVVVSRLAYAEAVAAFRRKQRDEPSTATAINRALSRFQREWETLVVVELSERLRPVMDRLLRVHALRGADAVHLSSALLLDAEVGESLTFGCWDKELLAAARREGMETVPRTIEPR